MRTPGGAGTSASRRPATGETRPDDELDDVDAARRRRARPPPARRDRLGPSSHASGEDADGAALHRGGDEHDDEGDVEEQLAVGDGPR